MHDYCGYIVKWLIIVNVKMFIDSKLFFNYNDFKIYMNLAH